MKRILTTMCALTLLLASSVPALAAEPEQSASYYPTSVEEYMEGDSPRIKKVYQLSLADDPSQIPTEDFERDGRLYYLLDMTRKDEVGVDIQTITQTKTLASETNTTLGHADHYAALRLTLLDNNQGVLDKLTLRLKDVWGKQKIPNNPYLRDGVNPHIWVDGDRIDWYAYHPTQEDYRQLRQMASDYVETFRIQVPAKDHGPQLVYICAPLRGEVEKNIEFARQKAQEVFQAGNIPVCPHLMFPPIADPGDPVQDQAAREMGLRLVEKCQQVNVYGPVTEGMWAEIHRANKLDIPVVTDLKTKGRTPPRRKKSAKREEVK